MPIQLNQTKIKVKDRDGNFHSLTITSDQSELIESVAQKMERYIIRLVQNESVFNIIDIDGSEVDFDTLLTNVKNTSKYVVCVYGNSKLRPQYVGSSEIIFTGLHRDSTGADVLRMIVRPSGIQYDVMEIAKEDEVAEIKQDLSRKLTAPATASVGQFFKVASIDENGHYVLEAVDAPQAGVQDVQVAGTSIVQDGVAKVTMVGKDVFGVCTVYQAMGTWFTAKAGGAAVTIFPANDATIKSRQSSYQPLTPATLDLTVKVAMSAPIAETAGMIDGVYHYPAWTPDEQQASRERQGIFVMTQEEYDLIDNPTGIYIITSEETT